MNVPSEAARPIACEFRSAAMYWQHFATREKYQDAGGLSGTETTKAYASKGIVIPSKDLACCEIFTWILRKGRNIPKLFGRQRVRTIRRPSGCRARL
jgi:hypothetical protein